VPFFLGYFLLGKQKKVTFRRATPGLIIPMRHVDSGASTKGFRYGSAVQTVDRLLHLPGHLLVLHHLQDFMLQKHAVPTDSGEYVLEFDPCGEYV
jgi:hypothetical protein